MDVREINAGYALEKGINLFNICANIGNDLW